MKVYPLDRPRLSNEHIMAALFLVLVLFQIPHWLENPYRIVSFLVVLAVGLILELILSMRREGSVKCAVSASITVGIIYALFPGIPLWGGLLGAVAALVMGKHLWGGMGKNIFNPAMVGVLLLSFIFPTGSTLFSNDFVILLAMLLSLSFVVIRPYAALGLMIGMLLSLSLIDVLSLASLISSGVIFWGCIVVTDPVTITYRPIIGAIGGFATGLVAILFYNDFSAGSMAFFILCFNGLSFLLDHKLAVNGQGERKKTQIKTPYQNVVPPGQESILQLDGVLKKASSQRLTAQVILERMKDNEVVGLGGAAFPTHVKVRTVMDARVEEKVLIINAVECDPGLVHDAWMLRNYSEEVYQGVQLLCECIPFSKVILASKDLRDLKFQGVIRSVKVPDLYPIGAEKKLIHHLLGNELPYDAIPAQKGILVLNVQTIYSIYEAVYLNTKVEFKFITFANFAKKEAKILKVELGERVSEVVSRVYDGDESIFMGGGLMQAKQVYEGDVIEATTNFLAVGQKPRYKEGACSKCGICVARCPSGLEVYKIANLVDRGQVGKAKRYHPEQCISCGICSYYCLAGKNLSSKVQMAKAEN